jgi:flavin reductase (DIM6/NTAB) family NADH-FMN oxidoreductase RutF
MVIMSPERTPASGVDTAEFRRALGHFATGVTIVTYRPGAGQFNDTGEPAAGSDFRGATVNSFTSVSLDPPLVLVSLGKASKCAEALRPGRPFAVNVLHHGQRDLAMQFAGRPEDGFPVDWEVRAGVPHLAGCAAFFRCVTRDVHDAGDHVLVVGLVEDFRAYGHPPLLFYRGGFENLRSQVAAHPAEAFLDFPELW